MTSLCLLSLLVILRTEWFNPVFTELINWVWDGEIPNLRIFSLSITSAFYVGRILRVFTKKTYFLYNVIYLYILTSKARAKALFLHVQTVTWHWLTQGITFIFYFVFLALCLKLDKKKNSKKALKPCKNGSSVGCKICTSTNRKL